MQLAAFVADIASAAQRLLVAAVAASPQVYITPLLFLTWRPDCCGSVSLPDARQVRKLAVALPLKTHRVGRACSCHPCCGQPRVSGSQDGVNGGHLRPLTASRARLLCHHDLQDHRLPQG